MPDAWAQRHRPARSPLTGQRRRAGSKFPTSRSNIANDGSFDPGPGRIVNIEDYERTLYPGLIDRYEREAATAGSSVGSTQRGRAEAEPEAVPRAHRLLPRARAARRRSSTRRRPTARAPSAGDFNFDWSFDFYPLAYERPGPVMQVYRLRGGAVRPVYTSFVPVQRTETDHEHLARAIELAERGAGRVSPNPVVGAVVVTRRRGRSARAGTRTYGGPHAEVNAIAACGDADLRGATLYVSLEPCCHEGQSRRAPTRSSRAGIGRVVVASDDPTEKASGRGLGILRDEGVEVDVAGGELAARARLHNQAFRKHARTGRPWVLFKSAMSLDGKVATRDGDSKWISTRGPSRLLAHRWRAAVDAVVVGIGTALADDPQLTARIDGVRRQPRRVVFDATARLPLDSQLVAAAPEVPLVVVVSRAAPRARPTRLETRRRRRRSSPPASTSRPACARALDQLGALDPPVTSDPARGRPAPGRRVPRRRRDRRGAPLPRAAAARRPRGARPARGRGRRARSPTRCAR